MAELDLKALRDLHEPECCSNCANVSALIDRLEKAEGQRWRGRSIRLGTIEECRELVTQLEVAEGTRAEGADAPAFIRHIHAEAALREAANALRELKAKSA